MKMTCTSTSKDYREVYPEEHRSYDRRFITTEPELIKKIDKHRKMMRIDNFLIKFAIILFLIWLPTLFLFECELFAAATIILLSVLVVELINIIIACTIESKADNLFLEIIDAYHETDEYKRIVRAIKKAEEEAKDKHLEEIAKDLVESYAILDSDKYGKAKKIQLLKKYIDRSEQRK